MPTRRQLLIGSAALLGSVGLARRAAAVQPSSRRFIFVDARGGWDSTRVFSPMMGTSVAVESDATLLPIADYAIVDHASRPTMRRFFERYGGQTSILDGMLVRSVNHRVCERIVLTGASRLGRPDWATIIGAAYAEQHALPNVVLSGPTVPGELHRYSAVTGFDTQLQDLLDGEATLMGDNPVRSPPEQGTALIEDLLSRRVSERLATEQHPGELRMLDAYDDGLGRLQRLREDARVVRFYGDNVADQMTTAVSLLQHQVARCVCLASPGFDTHANIDEQNALLERLFDGLTVLMEQLALTPGTEAPTLAEETTIVVYSEMGRAPYLNVRDGKDHWPYTGVMMIGSGIRGGKRFGGYDDFLNGQQVDARTGELSDTGLVITPDHLGATLMALAGVDPSRWLPGIEPFEPILA